MDERLEYNPKTGIFRHKVNHINARKGCVAGAINTSGHRQIKIDGTSYLAHRLAFVCMGMQCPEHVDHADGDSDNNAFFNLRACTMMQNAQNSKVRTTSKTGIKNVHMHKATGKYRVNISVFGTKVDVGYFDDIELAELVAVEFRNKHHKEFSRHK